MNVRLVKKIIAIGLSVFIEAALVYMCWVAFENPWIVVLIGGVLWFLLIVGLVMSPLFSGDN